DHFTSKYMDVSNDPLYPFGHGLTYGRCTLSNFIVSPGVASENDTIEARVDVGNTGVHEAEETGFLFTHDRLASVTRPFLQLNAWGKVRLRPGEKKPVVIAVAAADLRFLGLDLTPVFEPGEIEVLVGPCADRSQLLLQTIRLQAR